MSEAARHPKEVEDRERALASEQGLGGGMKGKPNPKGLGKLGETVRKDREKAEAVNVDWILQRRGADRVDKKLLTRAGGYLLRIERLEPILGKEEPREKGVMGDSGRITASLC